MRKFCKRIGFNRKNQGALLRIQLERFTVVSLVERLRRFCQQLLAKSTTDGGCAQKLVQGFARGDCVICDPAAIRLSPMQITRIHAAVRRSSIER